jgi:hypothetical protein
MSLTRILPRFRDSRFEAKAVAAAPSGSLLWRILFAAAALLALAAFGLPGPVENGWSRVPVGARGAISAAFGRDDRSYHAEPAGRVLRAANPRHDLSIGFSPEGVRIGDPADPIRLSLRSVGRGEMLSTVAAAEPAARANRVEYCHEELTEWYVNGPFGLEQGFNLESRPGGSGLLTLSMTIEGDIATTVQSERGVTFARPGGSALAYEGLSAVDSSGRDLPARLEVAGDVVRIRVDDAGARYPIVVDPFIFKAALHPSDFFESIQLCCSFGLAVAVSGNTIVVGAPNHTSLLPGLAYVFVKPLTGWSGNLFESARLIPSVRDTADHFGSSVGIDGDTVVVGARGTDVGANENQGAAWVFTKPGAGWSGTLNENATLIAADGAAEDQFGSSAAISGDTVVVGAPLDDHPFGIFTIPDGGSAYVFVKPGAGWAGALNQSAKLRASDGFSASFGAQFGHSVGVSGDTVVAGAPFQNVGVDADEGAAYVFVKPVSGWAGSLTQNAKLNSPSGLAGDRAGTSVAISGDTAFVGVPEESSFLVSRAGAAYVFLKPSSGWAGTPAAAARLSASDAGTSDNFGLQASASGTRVVFSTDVNNAAHYFFIRPSGGWAGALTQTEKISTPGDLQFIGLSGNTFVAGSDALNTALVYERKIFPIPLNLVRLTGSIFNSGSTIPIEVQVADEDSVPISQAEAESMAAACEVRVSFSGESRAPGCAKYDAEIDVFRFNVKTPKSLAAGEYRISIAVLQDGVLLSEENFVVRIR